MTDFGPGTVTIGEAPYDFSCEVTGGSVTHEYAEVGSERTMLCGTVKDASRKRNDGMTFNLETDLMSSGLLAWLYALSPADDPPAQAISYIPNNPAAASWTGTVVPLLPSSIDGSEYGAPITASVTWPAVGLLTFAPGTP